MTTTVTTKLDEMWRALEAHQPAPEYADEWATMCKERTSDAAWAAHYAAPIGSAAWAAVEAAWAADAAAAEAADDYAQKAIDALREVKP
jgi:hypothetical protein